MGTGRKIGKLLLGISRGAQRMGEGFDKVLGEDRTRPGDSFSKDRAGKRAENFTRKAKNSKKAEGVIKDVDKGNDFLKSDDDEDEDSRRFM